MFEAVDRSKPQIHHAEAFPGMRMKKIRTNQFYSTDFCLTVGTAALPHLLIRYYTTPTVGQARDSVLVTIFILLLYTTAPAYAVLLNTRYSAILLRFYRQASWLGCGMVKDWFS